MTGIRYAVALGLVWSWAAGWAQTAPSPESEKALRERIGKFYQAHVDGKYRQAEQFIAEENKDDFYTQAKTKYLSYEESKIEYTDDATKAVVHTPTEMLWRVAQLGEMKLRKIVESNWKLVDGQWYWYQIPGAGMMVPFGPDGKPVQMKPGPKSDEPKQVSVSQAIHGFNARTELNKVDLDSDIIYLAKSGGAAKVSVKNNLPGVVKIEVQHDPLPGFDVTVEPAQLKPGESGMVRFQYKPPAAEANPKVGVKMVVQPTQQTRAISIVFEDKPEGAPAKAK